MFSNGWTCVRYRKPTGKAQSVINIICNAYTYVILKIHSQGVLCEMRFLTEQVYSNVESSTRAENHKLLSKESVIHEIKICVTSSLQSKSVFVYLHIKSSKFAVIFKTWLNLLHFNM